MRIENSWDSREIGSPVVKRFLSDEEERWYMWYHGSNSSNGGDTVGLAELDLFSRVPMWVML
ncbi:hypothetical protein MKX01_027597 [Papaver californicum]|nr:hypothetical protein MKX01_027597 [Papaver californicum]